MSLGHRKGLSTTRVRDEWLQVKKSQLHVLPAIAQVWPWAVDEFTVRLLQVCGCAGVDVVVDADAVTTVRCSASKVP